MPCQWAHHRPRSHVSCHAGPAGPKARRGGYLVGGRRSTYDLRVRVRKQGVVSFVAEQWKMHACKSQQRMVQCGHVFLQGSIVRAALARLFCSSLLAQLPFHPSHQARRCQMMLGDMRHHVQHLLQIVMCMWSCLSVSALRALRKEKNTSSRLVHRARCEVLSLRSARAQHEQSSSQRGPTLSAATG